MSIDFFLCNIMFLRFICIVAVSVLHFLLWANKIPLYGYIKFCLFSHHLGCFHLFAIINNAAVDIAVQIFLWICAFIWFGYRPSSGIAGSYGNCMFNFFRNWKVPKTFLGKLFSKVVTPFYMPISNVWIFQFLHILVNTYSFYYYSYPRGCEVVSQSGISFTFP